MSRFTYLDGNRFVLFVVKVAFLGRFGNLWRRLVDDDMPDAGDGASAAEDAHVAVLPGVHEPDNEVKNSIDLIGLDSSRRQLKYCKG